MRLLLSLLSVAWAEKDTSGEPTFATWVENPEGGAPLAVYVDLPTAPGPYPTIVFVPGGARGADAREEWKDRQLVEAGFALVRFDPNGRGKSKGTGDFNGPIDQEGLRRVIRYAIDRPDTRDDQVGVLSWSYGIVMATGALAGGNPGARWLIDYEGPPSRSAMQQCRYPEQKAHQYTHDCADDSYWGIREATRYIQHIGVPYHHVQLLDLHGDEPDEATQATTLAIMAREAGLWTAYNDLTPGIDLTGIQYLPKLRHDTVMPQLAAWAWNLVRLTQDPSPPPGL